jgi:hypothetical protein
MKIPNKLTNKDFPNKAYVNKQIPPTMENFNVLLEAYNNMATVVRRICHEECRRFDDE